MKKSEVVKKSRDFEKIIHSGEIVKNKEFVIYFLDNPENNHFGISVGKKIGNAVVRNYYKRIIRNICDKNKKLYSKSRDYIIIMRKGCEKLDFNKINDSFVYLIEKINKKEKENDNEKEIEN